MGLRAKLAILLATAIVGCHSRSASSREGSRMVTFSECASQGYTLGEVACSSCRAVARVFGDDSPSAAACRSCCTASLDWVSPRKYDVAVLKLAKHAAAQWGGVKEFLEKSASSFEALTIVDDPSSAPRLLLHDDDEEPESGASISIASFKIEHIEALLKSKLRGAA